LSALLELLSQRQIGSTTPGVKSPDTAGTSITIGAAGDVSGVLPRTVLQEAQAAEVTTEGALRAFLGARGCDFVLTY
jgi:hypothetical protein